jgi:hypothetical protein
MLLIADSGALGEPKLGERGNEKLENANKANGVLIQKKAESNL